MKLRNQAGPLKMSKQIKSIYVIVKSAQNSSKLMSQFQTFRSSSQNLALSECPGNSNEFYVLGRDSTV